MIQLDEDTKDFALLLRDDTQLAAMLKSGDCAAFNQYCVDFPHQYVDLQGSDFSALHLIGVDFSNVCLRGVKFTLAILHQVSFRGANLQGASFASASVKGTDFGNADVTGANFADCWLEDACWYRTRGLGFRLRITLLWRLFWGWVRPYPAADSRNRTH